MKFTPETKIKLECKKCEKEETITLGDLPATSKGFFVLPVTVQCSTCLNIISVEIKDE